MSVSPSSSPISTLTGTKVSADFWHRWLGHPNPRLLRHVLNSNKLPFSIAPSPLCSSCQLGKSCRRPLKVSSYCSHSFLDLIYSDVWGPSPIRPSEGHLYYVIFVDDFSKYIWFYPLFRKSYVFHIFTLFQALVERQFNTTIKAIQMDWGREFRALTKIFQSKCINHSIICPHTHEQNGMVERRHRHIVDTGLSILAHGSVPHKHWQYAFETSVYLINCLPSSISPTKSPFEIVFKKQLDYFFLKNFGYLCFSLLRPYNRHKFSYRSRPCVFLGYSPSHLGYWCLEPSTNRVYVARHVTFDEFSFLFTGPSLLGPHPVHSSQSFSPFLVAPTLTPPSAAFRSRTSCVPSSLSHLASLSTRTPSHSTTYSTPRHTHSSPTVPNATHSHVSPNPSNTQTPDPLAITVQNSSGINLFVDLNPPPSKPPAAPTARSHPMVLRHMAKLSSSSLPTALLTYHSLSTSLEPTCFIIANKHPEWRKAMSDEISALLRNGTWILVPHSPTMNIVGCKWVYLIKRKFDGSIDRFKARLVAKGFHQQSGLDFHETFNQLSSPPPFELFYL